MSNAPLADDLLTGIPAISEFLGPKDWPPRKCYYAAEQGYLPLFKIGTTWCGRKSEIVQSFSAAAPRAQSAA